MINNKRIASPLGTADFLEDAEEILASKFQCKTMDETLVPESKSN